MGTNIDLTAVWNKLVALGLVKNVFEDKLGRRLEAGVRSSPNGPELYAIDLATGTDICEPPRLKQLDNGTELQFTPTANLKPRIPPSGFGRQTLPASAAECKLACQNPEHPLSVRKRDFLLQVSLPNSEWRAIPNVTPLEPRGHIIWVPVLTNGGFTTFPHQVQVLTREAIEDFLQIVPVAWNMPTFFTSLYSGATANHLHFQSVYNDHRLRVESAARTTMGKYIVLTGYPANAVVFPLDVAVDAFWGAIEKLQTANYPINFIALSSGIYLFVRNPEHVIVEEFPGRPLGALEFAGHIKTSDINDFTRVTEAIIASAYAKATIDVGALAGLLGA